MSEPLIKSYVNTHDPEHPVQEDLVLYQLFEKARKQGNDGEFVSLETMERMTASQVYDKVVHNSDSHFTEVYSHYLCEKPLIERLFF